MMAEVLIKYPISKSRLKFSKNKLSIELGNGVELISDLEDWIEDVIAVELNVFLKVKGSPTDA